jgi:NadR type nicotinamide-nucleotide adenylyltransferase
MIPILKIAITGPECTGKSTIAEKLAGHYQTVFVPEYARDYVVGLNRPYTYDDVEHIARMQVLQAENFLQQSNRFLFLDTYLIITLIWFEVVFGRYPQWIEKEIQQNSIDLYLLCDTSIPWTPDKVRENGGEMRNKLFLMYKAALERYNCPFEIITGTGEARMLQAIQSVDHFFS